MSRVPRATRRRVLQALGVGGTAAVAGCNAPGNAAQETPANTDPQTPTMNGAKQTDVDRIAADPIDVPDP